MQRCKVGVDKKRNGFLDNSFGTGSGSSGEMICPRSEVTGFGGVEEGDRQVEDRLVFLLSPRIFEPTCRGMRIQRMMLVSGIYFVYFRV